MLNIVTNKIVLKEESLRDCIWIGNRKQDPITTRALHIGHFSRAKTRVTDFYFQMIWFQRAIVMCTHIFFFPSEFHLIQVCWKQEQFFPCV